MEPSPSGPHAARHRGVTTILAMMYIVLFALLAVGFYASSNTSAQVSTNEQRRYRALGAAESGMDFLRYQLHQVSIPPTTTEANILAEIHNDLSAQLNGTPNMGAKVVGLNATATQIDVPALKEHYIKLSADGSKFRATITRSGRRIVVKVTGAYSDSTIAMTDRAAVQLTYDPTERPTDFFSNGLASRGAVTIDSKFPTTGFPASHANILTTTAVNPPVTIGSGAQPSSLAGDITVVGPNPPTILGGSSVGGTSNVGDILANHVKHLDPADVPEFPTPDTGIYKQFAVNNYVPGLPAYENITIPPNTNPTFNGGTIKGVVYIRQPNAVKFNGAVDITGIIVSENNGIGTLLTNTITFQGNGGTKQGVEALPSLPQFAGLKKLGGSFVLAPGFDVTFTGNFGAVSGHIVGDRVALKGSADASVTGSIVALKNTLLISNNGILNLVQDNSLPHWGMRFSDRYTPLPATYDEVKP